MSKRVYLINGPNLNFLGKRETNIYGDITLAEVTKACDRLALSKGMSLNYFQTNYEGQLIDWIQAAEMKADAIVINPGAYSHTSIALLDALNAFKGLSDRFVVWTLEKLCIHKVCLYSVVLDQL